MSEPRTDTRPTSAMDEPPVVRRRVGVRALLLLVGIVGLVLLLMAVTDARRKRTALATAQTFVDTVTQHGTARINRLPDDFEPIVHGADGAVTWDTGRILYLTRDQLRTFQGGDSATIIVAYTEPRNLMLGRPHRAVVVYDAYNASRYRTEWLTELQFDERIQQQSGLGAD